MTYVETIKERNIINVQATETYFTTQLCIISVNDLYTSANNIKHGLMYLYFLILMIQVFNRICYYLYSTWGMPEFSIHSWVSDTGYEI